MARAYDEALAKGVGAIAIDGVLIDVATVRAQANVLQRAALIGM